MKPPLVRLLCSLLVVSALALAGCDEQQQAAAPTPTASPEVESSPTATPTPTPSPVPEPPEFASFRQFAQEIDRALHERDAQFFVDRAIISKVRCTGRETLGMCDGQPAGTTFEGVWSSGANSGYAKILSPDDYQEHLLRELAAAMPLRADELGGGDLVFYALASSSVDGRPPSMVPAGQRGFYAITSAILARDPGHAREVRAFVFTWDDGDWGFRGELLVRGGSVEVYRAWLSGGITWYYDYWEPWTGAAP